MKIYNTLTRRKEEFISIKDKIVGLYTCGPTVYDFAHIGNLRAYLFEDVLRRVLEFDGYKVSHVQNITDVGHLTSDSDTGEDKLEVGAKREGKTAWEVAEFYTKAFKEDMGKLNILMPTIWPKVTDHIKEQIELIKKLEKKGFTYKISDGIYFDTTKLKDYGKLAKLDIKGLRAGARVEMGDKKSPTDFALWKFSPKDSKRQMEWDSPWGKGFPGWHIECSAMSMKYLGETFDMHAGGVDHIGVHHINEIAQSEAATGKKFVNYWVHNEHLLVDNQKMSKSLHNFYTLNDLIKKGFDPLAFRYLCLESHYRSKMNFTLNALEGAQNTLNAIRQLKFRRNNTHSTSKSTISLYSDIVKSFNNDLDTPKALALLHQVNDFSLWMKFESILGLGLSSNIYRLTYGQEHLIEQREEARKNKDFDKADKIRKELEKQGIKIEDTNSGQRILTQ